MSHGSYSLQSNTSGSENTAIGWSSMSGNTTGTQNTAIGIGSLANSDSGNDNVAVGGIEGVRYDELAPLLRALEQRLQAMSGGR